MSINASGVGGVVGTYVTASVAMRIADLIGGRKKKKYKARYKKKYRRK